MSPISQRTESELAALADGSLEPGREAELLARVCHSPELSAELDSQRRALALMRGAEVTAPDSLGDHLASLLAARAGTDPSRPKLARKRHRRLFAGALATAIACVAVIAILLTGGSGKTTTGAGPSLRESFALTLGPATVKAPPQSSTHPARLDAGVEGVSFPDWSRFGWRSVGARADLLDGRRLTTVFYADALGRRIGYAILAGAAPSVSGGTLVWHRGAPYRVLANGRVAVVTWTQAGHACVISGRGVSAATLVRLAGWSDLEEPARS